MGSVAWQTLHLPKLASSSCVWLGHLGQHCARILKKFGVVIHAIETVSRHHWALPQIPGLIDSLVIGDCRLTSVLEQADVGRCRAILLVTGDERTNLAAAFAVRSLNPDVRVVLRSAQENLNALLTRTLGNVVAFEPTALANNAFTLAALGDDTAGTDHQAPMAFMTGIRRPRCRPATIAYGYGLVPVLHERAGRGPPELLASDDHDVLPGDRLIVLATSDGLRARRTRTATVAVLAGAGGQHPYARRRIRRGDDHRPGIRFRLSDPAGLDAHAHPPRHPAAVAAPHAAPVLDVTALPLAPPPHAACPLVRVPAPPATAATPPPPLAIANYRRRLHPGTIATRERVAAGCDPVRLPPALRQRLDPGRFAVVIAACVSSFAVT